MTVSFLKSCATYVGMVHNSIKSKISLILCRIEREAAERRRREKEEAERQRKAAELKARLEAEEKERLAREAKRKRQILIEANRVKLISQIVYHTLSCYQYCISGVTSIEGMRNDGKLGRDEDDARSCFSTFQTEPYDKVLKIISLLAYI